MSAGGAFGGNRGARPVPPEKGVFPLDHLHLCDLEKKEYITCLKTSGHKSEICRPLSKKYLECRMAKKRAFLSFAQTEVPEQVHLPPFWKFDGEARHVRTWIWEGRKLRSYNREKRKRKAKKMNFLGL